MTEPNGSTLHKCGPVEPSSGVGTMLQPAQAGPQEPPEIRAGRPSRTEWWRRSPGSPHGKSGINALGGGFTRTMGAVRDRVPGGHASAGRGIEVEVGKKQTSIDRQVVVE